MEYIEAPHTYSKSSDRKAVFLAGGITNCPDWQSEITNLLNDQDVTLLNPRRKDFPINDPKASEVQINWEFENLRNADLILFWFPKESICPIALYELGAWCMASTPVLIGVHPEYERRIDIEVQTSLVRPEVEIVYSVQDLARQVTVWAKRGRDMPEGVKCSPAVECESPAVHSYLSLLQAVINRMASNSAGCKSWCITVVSGLVVLLLKEKANYILIATAPVILFCFLDCYYLAMEKLFRRRYNGFVKKLHSGDVSRSDLFVISPEKEISSSMIIGSFRSASIYLFYCALAAVVVAIWCVSL
ncbi:MAG: hypothetical protein C4576_26930 [Desulfobacteraceae bacterium]|nr:MAG: hypothetical protein C4576_26930 [Desulfobacteraceae bacterium]